MGVGLAVAWGEPRPRTQLRGATEAGHVADLGHENSGQDRSDPGDGLDGVIAAMILEDLRHHSCEDLDLVVERVDQAQQRIDASPVGVAQGHLIEEAASPNPEEVGDRHPHALLGQNGVDLGFEPGPDRHQLGAVADQFA